MPRGDGTGPVGQRGKVRRGFGICNKTDLVESKLGRGFRCKSGFRKNDGCNFGKGFGANENVCQSEKELLTKQKELLEDRLNTITEQLNSLPKDN